MVQCFEAECNHQSERETCKMFRFPKTLTEEWKRVVNRRLDKEPGTSDRLCSCHFENGDKSLGPTLLGRKKYGPAFQDPEPPRKKKVKPATVTQPTTVAYYEQSQHQFSPVVTDAIMGTQQQEIKDLKKQLTYKKRRFTVDEIKSDNSAMSMYTGLPNYTTFCALLNLCEPFEIKYWAGWTVGEVKKSEQLLMTLMKLRQNFRHLDLSYRFDCSKATVTNIVITWIHVLDSLLCKNFLKDLPSLTKNRTSLPSAFQDFQNCRIVLDCTEIFIKVPKSMREQNQTWSSYKHRNTFKALVGVAPNGVITYVSDLYGGCTSDKAITVDCGILDKLSSGDLVLADKGFLIHDVMPAGVSLNIPPFLSNGEFTEEQCLRTRSIARARIHVERAIQRIKMFSVLDEIPSTLRQFSNNVWRACVGLTNLGNPLIKEPFVNK